MTLVTSGSNFQLPLKFFLLHFVSLDHAFVLFTGVSSLPHSQPLSIQTYTPPHSHKASFK